MMINIIVVWGSDNPTPLLADNSLLSDSLASVGVNVSLYNTNA